tara:strand:- start:920 stop:1723 length:804 start_codon:yes stop_codon:yes gene_type:complete
MNEKIIKKEKKTSINKFLNGTISIEQFTEGGRSGSDTILLASAVNAKQGDTILEVGVGNGVASIALAKQLKGIRILGIDSFEENVRLAKKNIDRNNLSNQVFVNHADITKKGINFSINHNQIKIFEHVFMNPPYYDIKKSQLSVSKINKVSKFVDQENIDSWIEVSYKYLRSKGTLTVINKIANLDRIINTLYKLGSIKVLPLITRHSSEPKRVIISFRKESKDEFRILPPLILHEDNGYYKKNVEDILRGRSRINMNKTNYIHAIR